MLEVIDSLLLGEGYARVFEAEGEEGMDMVCQDHRENQYWEVRGGRKGSFLHVAFGRIRISYLYLVGCTMFIPGMPHGHFQVPRDFGGFPAVKSWM